MSLYKVIFQDNHAVSTTEVSATSIVTIVKFDTTGSKLLILWYILDAENESQAIEIANKVVKDIWGKALDIS